MAKSLLFFFLFCKNGTTAFLQKEVCCAGGRIHLDSLKGRHESTNVAYTISKRGLKGITSCVDYKYVFKEVTCLFGGGFSLKASQDTGNYTIPNRGIFRKFINSL